MCGYLRAVGAFFPQGILGFCPIVLPSFSRFPTLWNRSRPKTNHIRQNRIHQGFLVPAPSKQPEQVC
jgi:hypothetical protein